MQKTFKLNYTTHIKMINDLEELLKRQHISILNMNYVQTVHYLSLCIHLKDSKTSIIFISSFMAR